MAGITTIHPIYLTSVAVTPSQRQFTVTALMIDAHTKYLILAGVVVYADGTKVTFDARDMMHKWARGPAAFSRASAISPFFIFGWDLVVQDYYALDAGTAYDLSNLVTEKENVAATDVYLSIVVLA